MLLTRCTCWPESVEARQPTRCTTYIYIHTYIHTCIYMYMYVFMYVCVYIYTYIHTCIHTHTHIYMYVCMYLSLLWSSSITDACVSLYLYLCVLILLDMCPHRHRRRVTSYLSCWFLLKLKLSVVQTNRLYRLNKLIICVSSY
jgi:hypothetical protein